MSSEVPKEVNEPLRPVGRNFGDLGRSSLLSRDPESGLPRELKLEPIEPKPIDDPGQQVEVRSDREEQQ